MVAPIDVSEASKDHCPAIADIYNAALLSKAATFETRQRSPQEVSQWLKSGYPLKVARVDGGVAGFAKASSYRQRDCYAGIWEYSVYVDPRFQRLGVGKQVLEHLIIAARQQGAWKLLSRIFPENIASIELAKKCGFRIVGTYKRHGQLNGQWKDCVIVELPLI